MLGSVESSAYPPKFMSLSSTDKGLLTPDNCAVLFIDHQPQMFFGVANIDRQDLLNNVLVLAKAAKLFRVPVILTAVESEEGEASMNTRPSMDMFHHLLSAPRIRNCDGNRDGAVRTHALRPAERRADQQQPGRLHGGSERRRAADRRALSRLSRQRAQRTWRARNRRDRPGRHRRRHHGGGPPRDGCACARTAGQDRGPA